MAAGSSFHPQQSGLSPILAAFLQRSKQSSDAEYLEPDHQSTPTEYGETHRLSAFRGSGVIAPHLPDTASVPLSSPFGIYTVSDNLETILLDEQVSSSSLGWQDCGLTENQQKRLHPAPIDYQSPNPRESALPSPLFGLESFQPSGSLTSVVESTFSQDGTKESKSPRFRPTKDQLDMLQAAYEINRLVALPSMR